VKYKEVRQTLTFTEVCQFNDKDIPKMGSDCDLTVIMGFREVEVYVRIISGNWVLVQMVCDYRIESDACNVITF
jgi:hypothetical protein